jgi:hypothetical protein
VPVSAEPGGATEAVEPAEIRYSDCPGTAVDVLVDAAPAAVWRLVSEIDLPARFSNEFLGAVWLDGADGPRVGACFAGRNRHAAIGEWETRCTVVELEPERVFCYVVGEPSYPATLWRYTLSPEGRATRLELRMRLGPARSGINRAIDAMPDKESRILRRRLSEHRANIEATLLGIKAIAES